MLEIPKAVSISCIFFLMAKGLYCYREIPLERCFMAHPYLGIVCATIHERYKPSFMDKFIACLSQKKTASKYGQIHRAVVLPQVGLRTKLMFLMNPVLDHLVPIAFIEPNLTLCMCPLSVCIASVFFN